MGEDQVSKDDKEKRLVEFETLLEPFWWGCVPHEVLFADLIERMASLWLMFRLLEEWKEVKKLELPLPNMTVKSFSERSWQVAERFRNGVVSLLMPDHTGSIEMEFQKAILYVTGQLSALSGPDTQLVPREPESGDLIIPKREACRILLSTSVTIRRYMTLMDFIPVLRGTESDREIDLIQKMQKDYDYPLRTRRFLIGLSRCYLYRFDVECLVMCRGALEAELDSCISNDACIDVLGPRPMTRVGPAFTFSDRIAVARKLDLVTDEQVNVGHDIRRMGNLAVHEMALPPECDLNQAIEQTLDILHCLQKE